MRGLQGVCLLIISHASNVWLFFILAAIIYLCYGGGFGTMPATAGDSPRPKVDAPKDETAAVRQVSR